MATASDTMPPAPTPWNTLHSSMNQMLGEKMQAMLKASAEATLESSTGRLPCLSLKGPLTSMPAAMNRKNTVIVRLARASVVPRSAAMVGSDDI